MDSTARQHQWQVILQMTEQLQQLSEGEDWQAMIELGTRRQIGLEKFFAISVSAEEAEEVATGIRQILHSDQRLVHRGRHQQMEMSEAVKKISGTRQAIRAYTHVHKS